MAHRTKVCGKMRQPDLVFDVDVTAWLQIGSARQVENGIRYKAHQINQKYFPRWGILIYPVYMISDPIFNLKGRPNFQPSRYVNVEHQIWLSHFPANFSAMGHSWDDRMVIYNCYRIGKVPHRRCLRQNRPSKGDVSFLKTCGLSVRFQKRLEISLNQQKPE